MIKNTERESLLPLKLKEKWFESLHIYLGLGVRVGNGRIHYDIFSAYYWILDTDVSGLSRVTYLGVLLSEMERRHRNM